MTQTFEYGTSISLSPEYIVGFTDGEGCFTLHISKRTTSRYGLILTPSFSVSQNTSSVNVLLDFQAFFGCGRLRKDRGTTKYEVRRLQDLREIILPFFKQYPLRTTKRWDVYRLHHICDSLGAGDHHTLLGMRAILEMAHSMNGGGRCRRLSLKELEAHLQIFDKVKV
jgi:hypothetical protein